ncbi:MAG: YihY/virulence factor BrkB family protein [Flavobacteriaceae bacterium]
MSLEIEERLDRIPIIKWVVRALKRIKLYAFEGLSLYDLIEMYIVGIVEGALSTRASAIAFSLFTALFPLLIFLITLIPFIIPYASVGTESFDAQFLLYMESFLPEATADYFRGIYQQIKEQKRGGLLSTAFLLSIFLMTNGVNAIFEGFEYSYHIELTRNFLKQYAYALMVGLILSVLFLVGAVVYVYFEFYILNYLSDLEVQTRGSNVQESDIVVARIVKVLFLTVLTYLTVAILYYFGTADSKKSRFFSYGALMTTLLIMLTSYLFGIYVDDFARYNELYGALGGLLILLFYIWLNSNLLLLGFELNATLNVLRKKPAENERA